MAQNGQTTEMVPRALTGIRPTGDLTVANYVGSMQQMIGLQDNFEGPVSVFVADLHGLTDQEPSVINASRLGVVRAYMAAGIDPEKTSVYLQSQIGSQTVEVASALDRHMTVAELMRVPTLKDKIKKGAGAETATVALARYPILMAADIIVQDATHVPVGEDQLPHIEVTRVLARRFNRAYGKGESLLVVPEHLAVEAVNIAALSGDGKMSKSRPEGAIFLTDGPDVTAKKIKRAQTAIAGEMTPALQSHLELTKRLADPTDVALNAEIAELEERHLNGEQVMGKFKGLMTHVVNEFLTGYQDRLSSVSDADVKHALRVGGEQAREQADTTLARVRTALGVISDEFIYEG